MSKLLPHHPLADLFPIDEGELAALTSDIISTGLQRPILTTKLGRKNVIVDGRRRQLACNAAGISPEFEEWDGNGNLLDVICALNLQHRSMSKSDLAVAAEAAMEYIVDSAEEDNASAAKLQKDLVDRRADLAAVKFGVSQRYIYQVRAIRKTSPKTYELLRNRQLNLSQAANRIERHRREREAEKKASLAKVGKSAMKLIHGDTIAEMKRLAGGSVTVGFFDPPYNNKWKYDADPFGDDLTEGEYLDWNQQWINEAVRLLAPNGSMFVLIDDRYSDHLGILLRRSGLHRRNTIVHWESFGVHQKGNFSKCARYLHYYTKEPKGYIWLPEPIESARLRLGDVRADIDGKCPDNVWYIPRVNGNDGERAPFEDMPPQVAVELPYRAIYAASEPGDLVLDGFNGNGTTGLAALMLGRKYIGIDRSAKYLRQSEIFIKAGLAKGDAK